ncbi:TPA: hypothetical protein ACQTXZ_006024 [Pseudomonas aeruginosa]|nr:hypothetical protein [Pseudomonas aeruginosa]
MAEALRLADSPQLPLQHLVQGIQSADHARRSRIGRQLRDYLGQHSDQVENVRVG